jgi:hypothetical protein
MTDVKQFRAIRAPSSIVGPSSPSGANAMPLFDYVAGPQAYGMAVTLSGAVTANVYKTVLSITGAGVVNYLGARTLNSTAKIASLRVTIDGIVLVDIATTSVNHVNRILTAIGYLTHTTATPIHYLSYNPVAFNSSLLVEIASSVTETDQTQLISNYVVF